MTDQSPEKKASETSSFAATNAKDAEGAPPVATTPEPTAVPDAVSQANSVAPGQIEMTDDLSPEDSVEATQIASPVGQDETAHEPEEGPSEEDRIAEAKSDADAAVAAAIGETPPSVSEGDASADASVGNQSTTIEPDVPAPPPASSIPPAANAAVSPFEAPLPKTTGQSSEAASLGPPSSVAPSPTPPSPTAPSPTAPSPAAPISAASSPAAPRTTAKLPVPNATATNSPVVNSPAKASAPRVEEPISRVGPAVEAAIGGPVPGRTVTPGPTPAGAKPKRNILAGKFRLKREIAKGAMGRVFLADQMALKREVAVKVLVPKFGGPDFDKRFMQEARAVASLSHPNIVVVHDYGKVNNNLLFMAMEYLKGPTLSQMVRETGSVSLGRACSIVIQIGRALRAAHKAGMIHRDLKPGNVIVLHDEDEGDQVKVLDFGLAKMLSTAQEEIDDGEEAFATREGLMLGTPRYMAPEQITAKPVDARTDIYSLGAVFYHMVAGVPPFQGDNDVEILHAQLKSTPKPIASLEGREDFPAEMQAFIDKCMSTKKEDRFETVKELISVLKGLVADGMANPETRAHFVSNRESAQTQNQLLSATAGYGSSSTSKVALAEPGSTSTSKPAILSDSDEAPSSVSEAVALNVAASASTGSNSASPNSIPAVAANDDGRNGKMIAAGVVIALLLAVGVFFWLDPMSDSGQVAEEKSVPTVTEDPASGTNSGGNASPSKNASSDKEASTRTNNAATAEANVADPAKSAKDVEDGAVAPPKRPAPRRATKSTRRKRPAPKPKRVAETPTPPPAATPAPPVESDSAATGLIDSSGGRSAGRASKKADTVDVGGVQLMSPSAVDRASTTRKKKSENVKIGDVILADDYE